MKLTKYILALLTASAFSACSDDDFTETIFPDVSTEADPTSYTYQFDTWLNLNFRDVYNVEFKYRMEDVEADMDYNLVPATFDNAMDLALLTKYLWFDTYSEHVGRQFLQNYGPRILHLIGSPAYNPTTGTIILGLAEGGLKVTLFRVNELTVTDAQGNRELVDINQLNEYYFRTMHHEFGHILHQTKSYPTEFNLLSTGRYDAGSWQSKEIGYVASQGFITPYSSSEAREDFAENIANYITRTDDQLAMIEWLATKGWTKGDSTDDDDAVYYCYYYLADPDKPEERTYCITSLEDYNGDYRVGIYDDKAKRFITDVTEAEAYITGLGERYGGIYPVEDTDNVDGLEVLTTKRTIVRNWFKDAWGLDFDELRDIVQRKQLNVDEELEKLRAEVAAIPLPQSDEDGQE